MLARAIPAITVLLLTLATSGCPKAVIEVETAFWLGPEHREADVLFIDLEGVSVCPSFDEARARREPAVDRRIEGAPFRTGFSHKYTKDAPVLEGYCAVFLVDDDRDGVRDPGEPVFATVHPIHAKRDDGFCAGATGVTADVAVR